MESESRAWVKSAPQSGEAALAMLLRIVMVVVVLLCVSSQAIPQQDNPGQPGGNAQERKTNQSDASKNCSPPLPFPLWFLDEPKAPIIQVVPKENAEQSAECAEEGNWTEILRRYACLGWAYGFSTPERATAAFTAVLAISTILLWIVTGRAARAGERQLRLAQQEFISSHRPKVVLRDVFSEPDSNGAPVKVHYVISNIGDTDAHIVQSGFVLEVVTETQLLKTPDIADRNFIGDIVLAAGEFRSLIFQSAVYSWKEAHIWAQGTDTGIHYLTDRYQDLFFVGRIVYLDGNKVRRQTAFRRRYEFHRKRFYPMKEDLEYDYAD